MTPRTRLALSLTLVVTIFFVASVGFMLIEERSFGESAYMTTITLSTVGFGEVWGLSDYGRYWAMAVIIFGIMGIGLAFSSFQAVILSGDIRREQGRRRMNQQIRKLSKHTIICGYGRMGRMILLELRHAGAECVIIEQDEERAQQAEEGGLLCVHGNAEDEKVLIQAGLERAASLVSVLPSDADNVYVALTARGYRTDVKILARAEQPSTIQKLYRAGANRVVCPHQIGATQIAQILTRPHFFDFMEAAVGDLGLELDEYEVGPDSPILNRSIKDLSVRQRIGALVVAIRKPDGDMVFNPEPDLKLNEKDTLLMIGRSGMADRLSDFQRI